MQYKFIVMQTQMAKKSVHYVFIADYNGMNTLFPQIIDCLKELHNNHISLLYLHGSEEDVFKNEIATLCKRFPASFIVYRKHIHKQKPEEIQTSLELIINTNTKHSMQIMVDVSDEYANDIHTQLRFLGIAEKHIELFTTKNHR